MKLKYFCLIIYLIVFTICSINPYNRTVWWAENLPIMILVLVIVIIGRHHEFSKTSIILMSILPVLHTIGGHYTFEHVPFGMVTDFFNFSRNHYDRISHFSVGLFAFPIAEFLLTKSYTRSRIFSYLFALFAILSVASIYEILEWQFAVLGGADTGASVLGSQGDVWDAQKDMLADGLGAMFAIVIFHYHNRKITQSSRPSLSP